MFSRRELLKLISTAPVAALAGQQAASVPAAGSIAAAYRARLSEGPSGRYRADATVTFLGLSIFSRAGVGSGTVAIERGGGVENAQVVGLRFTAGSAPDRTRGLNRLGYIQEYVVERSTGIVESTYFGFMTSSKEESFDQAKAALGATSKDSVPYTAVEGSATSGASAYRLYDMLLPAAYNYTRCDEVVRHVRDALAKRQINPSRQESTGTETARTFLYAVRGAMQSAETKIAQPFLYNGKHYRLEVQKSADLKMGQQFASHKLTKAPDRVFRINGTIQNVATGDKTPFKVWYEQGLELPLRFEYKPRTFLNLAFEQTPA